MKDLPLLKFSQNGNSQKKYLKEWLLDWNITNNISSSQNEEYSPDGTITEEQIEKLKTLVRPFDASIKPGQIRILSSAIVPDSNRPYYAAIIKQWDDDMVLLAPYSSFTIPATTGELLSEREDFSLKTLELWNARTVPVSLLSKSWLVDELSEKEIKDALDVFANITSGKELHQELKERVGLPVINKKDPRIEYQAQETELLQPLLNRTKMYESFIQQFQTVVFGNAVIQFAVENVSLPATAKGGDKKLSRCLVFKQPETEMLLEHLINGKHVSSASTVLPRAFETLRPKYKNVNLLQWEFDSFVDCVDSNLALAVDSVSKKLIGTGHITKYDEECILEINKILHSNIERVIDNPTEIILLVLNF